MKEGMRMEFSNNSSFLKEAARKPSAKDLSVKGTRPAPQKRRLVQGFSLIELIVVAAILGVLAASAIAGYSKYLGNTAKKRQETEANMIARAFITCTAGKDFDECSALNKIGFKQQEARGARWTSAKKSPFFCANISETVGGKEYKKCVHISDRNDKTTTHQAGTGYGTPKPAGATATCQTTTGKCG